MLMEDDDLVRLAKLAFQSVNFIVIVKNLLQPECSGCNNEANLKKEF